MSARCLIMQLLSIVSYLCLTTCLTFDYLEYQYLGFLPISKIFRNFILYKVLLVTICCLHILEEGMYMKLTAASLFHSQN